ncbi:phosphotransferase [Halostella sp. JP-L12]|uniref:phosphotransferase family protein n=1 Tax=Halostella TaxID=1843185 RepID=UPI0013CEF894|nr:MULTISPECIES: phosphotransferase [Halostella]NHN46705.1 phosphotransferase [Halostella sp. JP-L12]
MARDERLEPPAPDAVAAAAATALDRTVTSATHVHEGVNAVYRVDCADGSRAALKTPLLPSDDIFLAEPELLARVGRETTVPVPTVLATVESNAGALAGPYFLTRYREGRAAEGVLALSAAERTRLVHRAGRHLAAIHRVRVADRFGDLRAVDGGLTTDPGCDSWAVRFDDMAAEAADGLRGDARIADPDPRFADLAPAVREALMSGDVDRAVDPAVLHNDYRPANLVLAPEGDDPPLVRAVLDFGGCSTGDGLLDLAHAEDALVDMPLGGTAAAAPLRDALRSAYVGARGLDSGVAFGDRYRRYRLYARAWRLGLFEYWAEFAREDDRDAVARRWRAFVRELLGEQNG